MNMRLMNIILAVSVIGILSGCINAREPISSASEPSASEPSENALPGMDTLVFSSPKNDFKALDSAGSTELEMRNYRDMLGLFDKLNYTPEAWQAGIREIPRVYLPIIGDRWGSSSSKEITTENKKRLFFRALAPLILRSNELIMLDRERLGDIKSAFNKNTPLDQMDQIWILKLAKEYRLNSEKDELTTSILDELWLRVDVIPVSLALAQAAEESGWGTSRFAALGNAVYGQWSWGKDAIKPEQQREELGDYGIASFESLQQSICAYMINLNTHSAYSDLRDKRAELRVRGEKIQGTVLAEQLTRYSERGEEYVKGLKSLMDYNRLNPTDDAYLSDDPPIYLILVLD